jgi:hypothetical protein
MGNDPTSFESFLVWYGNHWFLGLLILTTLYAVVYHFMRFVFLIVSHVIRQRNIKHQGWPPSHLDADGSLEND